ncbi:rRNA maturation RNase YbeY [bacterium]|nr:rRNA maturation RNase YbeY [bacterium]
MKILIQNSQKIPVKVSRMRSIAQKLLKAEGCPYNTEVSVLLTDDKQIAGLNKQYRDVEGPTDVLSFSQIEGDDDFTQEVDDGVLGDVVISVERALAQSQAQGNTLDEEIDMLLVHGILHLLGYDHAKPEEEKAMFARQNEILRI